VLQRQQINILIIHHFLIYFQSTFVLMDWRCVKKIIQKYTLVLCITALFGDVK